MNLFLQLLGNGIAQGAVAMLYAAGFGVVYRSFQVSFLHRSDYKLATTLAWWRSPAREKDRRERAMAWLDFVGLADKADEPAGELSYGQFLYEGTVHTHGPQKEVLDNPSVRELYMGLSGGMAL